MFLRLSIGKGRGVWVCSFFYLQIYQLESIIDAGDGADDDGPQPISVFRTKHFAGKARLTIQE